VCSLLIEGEAKRVTTRAGQEVLVHSACWNAIVTERREQRERAIKAHAMAAGVPPWWWAQVGTEEFIQRAPNPKLQGAARNYEKTRGNLSIIGPSGGGKTSTLAAIAHRFIARALTDEDVQSVRQGVYRTRGLQSDLRWLDVPALAAARREHPLGRGPEPLSAIAQWKAVVILDDVGQEQSDPRWLLELLDERYRRGLVTLSSSGLTITQLEARYGSGATRRLIEPTGLWLDLHEGDP
jgi:DNA replication protein DnaC